MRKLSVILFLSLLVLVTIIFGIIYITQQQSLRMGANDPQIQLAEDTAALLNGGASPKASSEGSKVDMKKSLAPFVLIYDRSGYVVGGNGYLDNRLPTIPFGALQSAEDKEYTFVSWQPQSGVRVASVSVAAKNYYVVSGRSLEEVEKRERATLQLVTLGWVGSILTLGVSALLFNIKRNKRVSR